MSHEHEWQPINQWGRRCLCGAEEFEFPDGMPSLLPPGIEWVQRGVPKILADVEAYARDRGWYVSHQGVAYVPLDELAALMPWFDAPGFEEMPPMPGIVAGESGPEATG